MARRVYFREIYLYIVCLIALVIFIVGLVMVYDSSINYVKPTTYMTRFNIITMYSADQYQNLSKEEIEQLAEDELNASLQSEKDIAFKGLLRGILLVIISIPLFAFHWRKAQAMWRTGLETKDTD
ncbi:MAG: hypothetical protein H8E13_01320 [Actinobacteria bacterium]|nr:hypothetical protein [Actinomycetota bacterium]